MRGWGEDEVAVGADEEEKSLKRKSFRITTEAAGGSGGTELGCALRSGDLTNYIQVGRSDSCQGQEFWLG